MTKEFLDNQQYTELSILCYEAIYGHNYISPGGEKATDQFIGTLKLLPGMRVPVSYTHLTLPTSDLV